MSTVEESVEVAVPVRTAYNQWTQFESFPEFMEAVVSVTQGADTMTHWVTEVGGAVREFDAQIVEQIPDTRIAWRSLDGPDQAGVVTFHRLDDEHCRVMLQMTFEPDGVVETVGDKLGIVRSQVETDLRRFKEFIEARGSESGAWRGQVDQPAKG